MQGKALVALVAIAFTTGAVAAVGNLNEYDVSDKLDDEKATWQEIKAELPPYPKPGNLIEVQAGPAGSHRYYIDAGSLSLGKDNVMRYSAVAKMTGGATNITFEGIRCETRERKIYAVGHRDGTWAQARDPNWRRIERHHPAVYMSLWRDYFCPERTMPTKPSRAVDAIRRGEPLASGATSAY